MAKLGKRTINFVVSHKLCTGCGTCVGVCPTRSIRMIIRGGIYLPEINYATCSRELGCSICYDLCPGQSIHLNKVAKECFPFAYDDLFIGRFLKCYAGYSADGNNRFHAASGGLITQLLVQMFEDNTIDSAVVARMNPADPLIPEVCIASSKEEIECARSSKYCPVALNIIIKEILANRKKYAIVGLPCHIHGFRKAER